MPDASFQITRLDGGRKADFTNLAAALGAGNLARETWLFVSPHDDDLCLSCGLLMQQAVAEGVNVQVLVVTDGRMGYCTLEQRDTHRRDPPQGDVRVVRASSASPSSTSTTSATPTAASTRSRAAARHRPDDEVKAIEGYVGLQNAFTYHLRRTRATRVFVPTSADLHPDHQVTHNELMICLFHAAGTIWPELGEPLADVPKVYELAIYCDFPAPPQLQIQRRRRRVRKEAREHRRVPLADADRAAGRDDPQGGTDGVRARAELPLLLAEQLQADVRVRRLPSSMSLQPRLFTRHGETRASIRRRCGTAVVSSSNPTPNGASTTLPMRIAPCRSSQRGILAASGRTDLDAQCTRAPARSRATWSGRRSSGGRCARRA